MFSVGDTVVCVNSEYTHGFLTAGNHYSVSSLSHRGVYVRVDGHDAFGWDSSRFVLVSSAVDPDEEWD